MIDHGADPNHVNGSGDSVLCWAVSSGNLRLVRLLLDKGAEVNLVSPNGTALLTAVRAGNLEMVKLLVRRGADMYLRVHGPSPMEVAERYGMTEILGFLQDKAGEQIERPEIMDG